MPVITSFSFSNFDFIISDEHNNVIRELMKTLIGLCESSVTMYPCEDLHVSLTKTVVLRHHWIESFISTISSNISHIGQFVVFFDSLKVYCNEERTRTFIGLNIRSGYDTLISIVQSLNMGLQEYNLPKFYEVSWNYNNFGLWPTFCLFLLKSILSDYNG